MKKLIYLLIVLFFSLQVNADTIDSTIKSSGINKGAVSVCVKDVKTGKTVYSLNENQPSLPASTLKIITLTASREILTDNYEFSTKLYKTEANELYLKLSADPFLTSSDLGFLINTARKKNIIEPKAFYIDDYIFDSTEWGEGWQWDDDLNPLMPKFSSYNLDGNMLNIVIIPTEKNSPAEIRTTKFYPVTFMNLMLTSSSNDAQISRNNSISPDIITVKGTVKNMFTKQIPVNYPKRYFILRLEDALRSKKIDFYGKFIQKKTPTSGIYLVGEINHPIAAAYEEILKNSNNLVAETIFKSAGAKFSNSTGSLEKSQKMLNSFLEKYDIKSDDIKIVDGSGVSKNNLVTAEFMAEFLVKFCDKLKDILPSSGEGTLSNRMLYFKDNLRAKTGTLSDVSAIAGYITSRCGNLYAFDIMINDAKSSPADKKSLEEYIIRDIFANF